MANGTPSPDNQRAGKESFRIKDGHNRTAGHARHLRQIITRSRRRENNRKWREWTNDYSVN